MKKIIILLIILSFVTGCSISKVKEDSINEIFDSILYKDNNLSNTFMNGYKFYLPKGLNIVDQDEYNLKIKDQNNYYYLYIDTIAYHYHSTSTYEVNDKHKFSEILSNGDIEGYIDIEEVNDKYFIVLMYNYAKVEAYVDKEDYDKSIINMSYILSTIKFNDSLINEYVSTKGSSSQEEIFNIFSANKEKDNFLTYEKEYGTFTGSIDIKDVDVIDVDDIE